MSEKYDPYENVIVERINAILKQEFNIARDIQDLNLKQKLIIIKDHSYQTKCKLLYKCTDKKT